MTALDDIKELDRETSAFNRKLLRALLEEHQDFHQGRNLWKWAEAKVWHIVVDLRTKFPCVFMNSCIFTRGRGGVASIQRIPLKNPAVSSKLRI